MSQSSSIRVVIADDSLFMRATVSRVLSATRRVQVLAAVGTGQEAVEALHAHQPAVLILDWSTPPTPASLQVLRSLRLMRLPVKTILLGTQTDASVSTLGYAGHGAEVHFVSKPSTECLVDCLQRLEQELVPKVLSAGRSVDPTPKPIKRSPTPQPFRSPGWGRRQVIAIGSSTGGPEALLQVISFLPAALPVPVLVVQHMPSLFTERLAKRLNELSAVQVKEAQEGEPVRSGLVYIAPGGYHMTVANEGAQTVIRLNTEPPVKACRPAVDVLFRSIAKVYGGKTVAAVLTGMGSDGTEGCRLLKAAGAQVVAQSEKSCVVYGMPRAVVQAQLADDVVDLQDIAAYLTTAVAGVSQPVLMKA